MRLFERIFFFLLLASIPIQLGKHFWPNFAFVYGIRVDYLSPTLYVSDILFLLLFAFSITRLIKPFIILLLKPLFLFLISVIFLGAFFAQQPVAALFGAIKLLEFVYIAFYVAQSFRLKDLGLFTYIFTLGALVETIIIIFQFFSQHSLGGIFYFLGERTFTSSTPGIAAFQFNNQLLLRPYGTFPHPNVLAFYLLFAFVFLIHSLEFKKKNIFFIKMVALLFLSIGILLTFSRIVILLLMLSIIYWLMPRSKNFSKKNLYVFGVPIIVLIFFVSIIFLARFESGFLRDSLLRFELLKIAWSIFVKYPLFGVGLNNFYYHEILFQKNVSPTLLQPVHNIYILWLVQTGILGFSVLCLFFIKIIKHARFYLKQLINNKYFFKAAVTLLFGVLIIGIFDHYPMTLQQGQLLCSVLFGILYLKLPSG